MSQASSLEGIPAVIGAFLHSRPTSLILPLAHSGGVLPSAWKHPSPMCGAVQVLCLGSFSSIDAPIRNRTGMTCSTSRTPSTVRVIAVDIWDPSAAATGRWNRTLISKLYVCRNSETHTVNVKNTSWDQENIPLVTTVLPRCPKSVTCKWWWDLTRAIVISTSARTSKVPRHGIKCL